AIAEDMARLVRFITPVDAAPVPDRLPVPTMIEESLTNRRVLRLTYRDRDGARTEREVEPVLFLSSRFGWYLLAWCRLRNDLRAFRIDRILAAVDTGLPAPNRPTAELPPCIPDHVTTAMSLR